MKKWTTKEATAPSEGLDTEHWGKTAPFPVPLCPVQVEGSSDRRSIPSRLLKGWEPAPAGPSGAARTRDKGGKRGGRRLSFFATAEGQFVTCVLRTAASAAAQPHGRWRRLPQPYPSAECPEGPVAASRAPNRLRRGRGQAGALGLSAFGARISSPPWADLGASRLYLPVKPHQLIKYTCPSEGVRAARVCFMRGADDCSQLARGQQTPNVSLQCE